MKRYLAPVVLPALLAFFASCTNVGEIIATGLEVEITGIQRAGDHEAEVSWRLKNPNVVSYLFSHITHKIRLNGTPLGTIDEKDALALPAKSDSEHTGKLTGLDPAASRALADAAIAGSASYQIDTELTVLIYDDNKEKSLLSGSGSVTVKNK